MNKSVFHKTWFSAWVQFDESGCKVSNMVQFVQTQIHTGRFQWFHLEMERSIKIHK